MSSVAAAFLETNGLDNAVLNGASYLCFASLLGVFVCFLTGMRSERPLCATLDLTARFACLAGVSLLVEMGLLPPGEEVVAIHLGGFALSLVVVFGVKALCILEHNANANGEEEEEEDAGAKDKVGRVSGAPTTPDDKFAHEFDIV